MLRWLLAAVHLLAVAIGLGGIWARGHALRAPLDPIGLQRVLYADNWWGISALVLIPTGLVRAFGSLEKGPDYYVHNDFFLVKMGLLLLILALEIWPMVTFIKWRIGMAKGATVDASKAPVFARISFAQAALLALMVLAATAMARGLGS